MKEIEQLRNCYLNISQTWSEMGELYFKIVAQRYIETIGNCCFPQGVPVILPVNGQLIDGEIKEIVLNSSGESAIFTVLNNDTMEEIENVYMEDFYSLTYGDVADILYNELIEHNENIR